MEKFVLLGDEAVAQGALDAGLSGVYAYPGTPSTEITEYIQRNEEAITRNVHREWSANEKTALEAALGMSYVGKRAMACMKHVGVNVAADPFINSGLTGTNGGLIVVAADDPSMHSSQNEQDSRFYAKFALLPALEPSNQQEAYDMTFYGFDLSEQAHLPVMLRVTTRVTRRVPWPFRRPPCCLSRSASGRRRGTRRCSIPPAMAGRRGRVAVVVVSACERRPRVAVSSGVRHRAMR